MANQPKLFDIDKQKSTSTMTFPQPLMQLLLLAIFTVFACSPTKTNIQNPGSPLDDKVEQDLQKPEDLDQSLSGELNDLSVSGSGVRDGNGGDVVHCQAPVVNFGNHKVFSLDLYETYLRKLSWKFIASDDYIQIAMDLIEQFKIVDATRYEKYKVWVQNFASEALISDNLYIPQLADEGAVSLPAGCMIEQLVYHRQTILDATKRYMIKKSLWDAMDASNKAAIVLHEILYREGLDFGHQNSRRIRLFVSYLAARKIASMDSTTYQYFISEIIQFRKFEIVHDGMIFLGASVTYFPNDKISKGMLAKPINQKIGNLKFDLSPNTIIQFRENGSIASIEYNKGFLHWRDVSSFSNDEKLVLCDGIFERYQFDDKNNLSEGLCKIGSTISVCGEKESHPMEIDPNNKLFSDSCREDSKTSKFHDNGKLKSYEPRVQSYLKYPTSLLHSSIQTWPPIVAIKIASPIQFHSSGRLKSFVPSENITLNLSTGTILNISAGTEVSLSENGAIIP